MGLRRSIGLVSLTLYGLGVTIGAGVFVLIGETAGLAGGYAPLGFLLAGAVAALSALSYADMSSRFPVSAGEAAYVRAAFANQWLPKLVGFGVVCIGALSSATILQGFAGYAAALTGLPRQTAVLLALISLTGLTLMGVKESVWAAAGLTVIEICVLLFVVASAAPVALSAPVAPGPFALTGVIAAAAVAFFAYIGFEDIVNIAEETLSPERIMPQAILLTLIFSTLIYGLVVIVAVRTVPSADLASSADPIPEILRAAGAEGARTIGAISVLAILNGALVQMIMGSRVLYGMAMQGDAPILLSRLSDRTATPFYAILAVTLVIGILSLSFPLGGLARATSAATLMVFALVNLSLISLNRRSSVPQRQGFRVPRTVPFLGLLGVLVLLLGTLL